MSFLIIIGLLIAFPLCSFFINYLLDKYVEVKLQIKVQNGDKQAQNVQYGLELLGWFVYIIFGIFEVITFFALVVNFVVWIFSFINL